MNKIKRLVQSYNQYIAIPWRDDAAAAQRVIFCVYDEDEELRLRARIDEFELATRQAGHEWVMFDLTHTFAEWMRAEEYADEFFREPELLMDLLPDEYLAYIYQQFMTFLQTTVTGSVVAVMGIGTLFGFAKVKDLVDMLSPLVSGRMVVFFPGSYENNNYRLLDGYDGWNYLAVPITAGKMF